MDLDFTGWYFIPGKASGRLAADHLERYRFAALVGGGTLQGLYNRLWKPDQRSSPQVSRKANEIPRYYVVIARRPAF